MLDPAGDLIQCGEHSHFVLHGRGVSGGCGESDSAGCDRGQNGAPAQSLSQMAPHKVHLFARFQPSGTRPPTLLGPPSWREQRLPHDTRGRSLRQRCDIDALAFLEPSMTRLTQYCCASDGWAVANQTEARCPRIGQGLFRRRAPSGRNPYGTGRFGPMIFGKILDRIDGYALKFFLDPEPKTPRQNGSI